MVEIQDVTEGEGSTLRNRRVVVNEDANVEHAPVTESDPVESDEDAGEVAENPLSFDEQVDLARANFQPTPMEKFMAIMKSLILRALVVYFIMTFLRGNSSKPSADTSTTSEGGAETIIAAPDVFPNETDTEFDVEV